MKLFLTIVILFFMSGCHQETKSGAAVNITPKEAIDTVRSVFNSQQEWVKVHAAEFLIWTGNIADIKQAYIKELELYGNKPQYRIGIRRVLAQLSTGDEEAMYKNEIVKAFVDTTGKDRIHAIETMAKLKMSPLPYFAAITADALKSDVKSLATYTHWAIAYTNDDSLQSAKKYFLAKLLDISEDMLTRRIAAYVLRNSGSLDATDWAQLSTAILALPKNAEGAVSFLNAALLTAGEGEKGTDAYTQLFNRFINLGSKKDKATRMDVAAGLAVVGTKDDLKLLKEWMDNEDPTGIAADDADVQASAAYAIVRIGEREGVTN